MNHAHDCTRHGAGGCAGDGGETCTRCPAKAEANTRAMITAAARAEWRHQMHQVAIGVIWTALALATIGSAAAYGLGHQERHEQTMARV